MNYCDCIDCQNKENPCNLDCDVNNMCYGCAGSRETSIDREFDEKCVLGYL